MGMFSMVVGARANTIVAGVVLLIAGCTDPKAPSDDDDDDAGGAGAGTSSSSSGVGGSGTSNCPAGEVCYGAPLVYPIPSEGGDLAVGDFDADGRIDIVVTRIFAGELTTLMQTSQGMFELGPVSAIPGEPVGVLAGEFTGDSAFDLVISGQKKVTTLYEGAGDGTFTERSELNVSAEWSAAVDVDGDTDTDIISAFALATNYGNGQFLTESVPNPGNGQHLAFALGDMDGDSLRNDRVLTTPDAFNVFLWGASEWVTTPVRNTSAFALVADTFDADARADVVFGMATGQGPAATLGLLEGKGNGSLGPLTSTPLKAPIGGSASGDFNGDGLRDVAVALRDVDEVSLMLGDGAGGFEEGPFLEAEDSPLWMIVADLNDDGRDDLVVSNYKQPSVSVFLSQL